MRTVMMAAAVVLGGLAGAPRPAGALVPPAMSAGQRAVLGKAEAYLNGVRTMAARFVQITSSGRFAKGRVAIRRPGRLALSYDPPSRIRIIADGTWLIYVDPEVDQVSRLPLKATPAGILLRNDVRFDDADITVAAVRPFGDGAEIDMAMTDDPAAGVLTLAFSNDPFELRQWRVMDAQGVETTVSLFESRVGVAFDPGIFTYVDDIGARK